MRIYPEHEDLGLVDDDNTEDLRSTTKNAPGRCANTAEGNQIHPLATRQEI